MLLKNECVEDKIKKRSMNNLYKLPKFGKTINGKYIGHGPSEKIMVEI